MAVSPLHAVRRVGRAVAPPDGTDGEHLGRFLADGDADAFAELVRRHGPMVLAVCRRVLGNRADADDAFQATFLVLLRKGHAVRPREAVGGFLHAVARRTALHARAAAARRRAARLEDADVPAPAPPPDPAADWLPLLDAELAALPEKYRTPVVLCELEGRPLKAVADQLRVPVGTVASRLARGRALLANRLRKRGLAATAAAVSAALAGAASARVPPGLADGLAAPAPSVLELADGVLKMMLVSKLKGVGRAAVLAALTAAALAAGFDPGPTAPALRPTVAAAPPPKVGAEPGVERKKLDALWDDLQKDEAAATRAVLALSARPRSTVPFLREKLKPLTLTEERARKLIAELGSGDEKVWKAAFEEMKYFDPRLAIEIDALLWRQDDASAAERRFAATLCGVSPEAFAAGRLHWYYPDRFTARFTTASGRSEDAAREVSGIGPVAPRKTWTRATRAVVLLEHIGTPDAVAVLTAMAGGHPDAGPTKAAKEALARLDKSK